jgi:soluble lytic murein transglycosylase-like protein
MLIGAAGIFAVGALAGGLGVAAFERISQDSPLKPESGDAQSNLVIEWLPDTVKRWKSQIEKYSSMYEIDPNLLAIMMTVESGGDPAADSGVAQGLMQITKPTADDIAKKYLKVEKTDFDLKTPETSIEFGAAYVRYLVGEFGDASQGPSWDETVSLVAAGYNGGPGGAIAYRDHKWKGLEEYAQQTFNYTRYVRVMWQERHDDKSFAYRFWYEQGNGQALVKDAEKYAAP